MVFKSVEISTLLPTISPLKCGKNKALKGAKKTTWIAYHKQEDYMYQFAFD